MNYNDDRLERSQSRVRIVALALIIMVLMVALLFVVGCQTPGKVSLPRDQIPNVTTVTNGNLIVTTLTYPPHVGLLDRALDFVEGKLFNAYVYLGGKY